MKIRCLANPNARSFRTRERLAEKLQTWARGIVPVTVSHTLEEARKQAEQCLRDGADVVLLASGDGGIHHFITSFLNAYRELSEKGIEGIRLPVFFPLKLGTANIISRSLGLARRPKRFLQRLSSRLQSVRSRAELPVIRRRPLRIFDGVEEKYGFLFGSGGIHKFFVEYYRDNQYGIPRFLKIFTRFVFSLFTGTRYFRKFLQPERLHLSVGGKAVRLREFATVVTSSIEAKIVFLRAFRDADKRGKLCVYAGKPGRFGFLRLLPYFLLGRHPRGRNIISEMTEDLELQADSEIGYVIDGERYLASSLHISLGPSLEFLKP